MKQKKKKVNIIVLAAAVTAVVSYAVVAAFFQLFTAAELSPTLTTAWFGFWGVEIIALAAIKTTKVKKGADNGSSEDLTHESGSTAERVDSPYDQDD